METTTPSFKLMTSNHFLKPGIAVDISCHGLFRCTLDDLCVQVARPETDLDDRIVCALEGDFAAYEITEFTSLPLMVKAIVVADWGG